MLNKEILSLPNEIMLPIYSDPLIKSSSRALLFCVLQANFANISPIIIDEYVNIKKDKYQYMEYNHVECSEWPNNINALIKHKFVINKQTIKNIRELLTLICSFISKGYYLFTKNNNKYIWNKGAYQLYDSVSENLVYGYNLEKELFYIAGKTVDKDFDGYTITFDTFIKSLLERDVNTLSLIFQIPNTNIVISEKFNKLHNGLVDYLYSRNRFDGVANEASNTQNIYGIKCYKEYVKQLYRLFEYKKYIEPSSYLVFLEHHKLLYIILEYLSSAYSSIPSKLVNDYLLIYTDAQSVYSDCLEFNCSFDPHLVKRIIDNCNNIIAKESDILSVIIPLIKKQCTINIQKSCN